MNRLNDFCRYPNSGFTGGYILQDNRIGTDDGVIAYFDTAKNFGACTYVDMSTNDRKAFVTP
jgi:hypothetical protein